MDSQPITSLEQLISFDFSTLNKVCTVPLIKQCGLVDESGAFHRESVGPKVIFCHDFAGGYHRYEIQPTHVFEFPTYRFTHWDLIDIFVYFSHQFITIPPVPWIDIAHRHNVSVYGTFIIEHWAKTPCILFEKIFCRNNNSSDVPGLTPFELATKLNTIRHVIGFEGWLINIETPYPDSKCKESFANMLHFLQCLKKLGSEVVWYDSVTRHGKLDWQNSLNDKNAVYLRTGIDGIFLNYNWNSELLHNSQLLASNSEEARKIFVGVDCFGRGCPGGGGFNTKVALDLILEVSETMPDRPLSVALFAPGWCFEKHHELASIVPTDCEEENLYRLGRLIAELDYTFWKAVRPLINRLRGIGDNLGGSCYRPLIPISTSDIFLDTYCQIGSGLFEEVEIDVNGSRTLKPWSFLGRQEVLPSCRVVKWIPRLEHNLDKTKSKLSCVDQSLLNSIEIQTEPDYCDYILPSGNSLRVDVVHANTDNIQQMIAMELFLFPNLCLSPDARLSVSLLFSNEVVQRSVRLFLDVCIIHLDDLFSKKSYPITHRQFINSKESTEMGVKCSKWTCLTSSIGQQLAEKERLPDIVQLVRRLGIEFRGSSLRLGHIRLIDPSPCFL